MPGGGEVESGFLENVKFQLGLPAPPPTLGLNTGRCINTTKRRTTTLNSLRLSFRCIGREVADVFLLSGGKVTNILAHLIPIKIRYSTGVLSHGEGRGEISDVSSGEAPP